MEEGSNHIGLLELLQKHKENASQIRLLEHEISLHQLDQSDTASNASWKSKLDQLCCAEPVTNDKSEKFNTNSASVHKPCTNERSFESFNSAQQMCHVIEDLTGHLEKDPSLFILEIAGQAFLPSLHKHQVYEAVQNSEVDSASVTEEAVYGPSTHEDASHEILTDNQIENGPPAPNESSNGMIQAIVPAEITLQSPEGAADQIGQEIPPESVEKPFKCTLCEKSFDTSRQLGGHKAKAHPGQSEKFNQKKQKEKDRQKGLLSLRIAQKFLEKFSASEFQIKTY